ncbi:unnamed protein product [Prunus armeniaca]|uniref:GPN-loop GTPase 2 n=1 Tax=Prunus armeniaca TaxID=36596 RepID=A0A6J5W5N1_PRUAR|nr:unnamed protein product [Prunus armeniaca]
MLREKKKEKAEAAQSKKTIYCNGMSQFLPTHNSLEGKKVAVVNLDPANGALPYECAVNTEDLRKLSDVVVEHTLGPNGAELVLSF